MCNFIHLLVQVHFSGVTHKQDGKDNKEGDSAPSFVTQTDDSA